MSGILGLDTSLLHVLDDNNSDTWSVDVAASEFELNEEQRLDDFLEDQLLLVEDQTPKGNHSRRGSRRSKKPHHHSTGPNAFLSSNSASNYEDFIGSTLGMEDAIDDIGLIGKKTISVSSASGRSFPISSTNNWGKNLGYFCKLPPVFFLP